MITILTPTYNRVHTLPRIYHSLVEQTKYSFEWLVIDDGSTDETEQLITDYQASCPFNIRYYKKENGGKHTALNVGFKKSEREWIFIVDSDDFLKSQCVEKMFNEIVKLTEEYNSIRILQIDKRGHIRGSYFPSEMNSYIQLINSGLANDNADIFRKAALSDFSFPEFEGENFMAESPIYYWLGLRGLTKFINYGGYVSEYLPEGLTDKSIENRHTSFNSSLYVYENMYKMTYSSDKKKHRAAVNWWRFRLFKGDIERSFIAPFYYIPFGAALFIKDSLKNKKIIKKLKK